jgi:hypothetical protein
MTKKFVRGLTFRRQRHAAAQRSAKTAPMKMDSIKSECVLADMEHGLIREMCEVSFTCNA